MIASLLLSGFALALLPGAPAQAHAGAEVAGVPAHVRITARIVVVDRSALARAGVSYVVLGNDRVRVSAREATPRAGTGVTIGTHGISAFLEAARARRWVSSESTQQVLVLAGAEASVGSSSLTMTRGAARARGPSLAVVPVLQPDGRVLLQVSARLEDAVSYPWGYTVDGSPAAVETEVVVRPGQEVLLASSSDVVRTRESGLLMWGSAEHERDVLVAVSVELVP